MKRVIFWSFHNPISIVLAVVYLPPRLVVCGFLFMVYMEWQEWE